MRYRETVSRRALEVTSVMALVVGAAGASEACRTATQVELDVTYDGNCADLQEVAFIVGTDPAVAESRIETNVFTTTTSHCEPGSPSRVGTLVVTPNDGTERASIIVLASFGGQHVTDCKPEKGYAGCIIARRAFAFVDHTALTLEIPLETSCKNVPCDAVSTCKHASCVSSETSCSGSGCGDPGVIADGGVELSDAPTDPDAYVQSLDAQPPPFDGSPPPSDASADAPFPPPSDGGNDAPVEASSGPGTCLDGGTINVSCNTAGMGLQICTPASPVCGYSALGAMMPEGGMPSGYACRPPGASTPSMQNPSIACQSAMNCPSDSVCCINMTAGVYSVSCTAPGSTSCPAGGMVIQACSQSCECRSNEHCVPGPSFGNSPMQSTLGICQPHP